MTETRKYLLTVNAETGVPIKIEQLGEAGELTEVPLSGLGRRPGGAAQPVVNIYVGGGGGEDPAVRVVPASAEEDIGFGDIQYWPPEQPSKTKLAKAKSEKPTKKPSSGASKKKRAK